MTEITRRHVFCTARCNRPGHRGLPKTFPGARLSGWKRRSPSRNSRREQQLRARQTAPMLAIQDRAVRLETRPSQSSERRTRVVVIRGFDLLARSGFTVEVRLRGGPLWGSFAQPTTGGTGARRARQRGTGDEYKGSQEEIRGPKFGRTAKVVARNSSHRGVLGMGQSLLPCEQGCLRHPHWTLLPRVCRLNVLWPCGRPIQQI